MNMEELINKINIRVKKCEEWKDETNDRISKEYYTGEIDAYKNVIYFIEEFEKLTAYRNELDSISDDEDAKEPSQPDEEDKPDKLSVGLDDEEMRQLIHDLIIYFDTYQLINLVNYLLSHMKVE